MDAHHRLAQLRDRRALGHVAGGARSDGLDEGVLVLAGGDDQGAGVGKLVAQACQDAQAVQPRHAEIEHQDVGTRLLDDRERLDAVGGLADNLDVRIALQRFHEGHEHQGKVVGDHDSDAHRALVVFLVITTADRNR